MGDVIFGFLFFIFLGALAVFGAIGWVLNILKIIHDLSLASPNYVLDIFRILGIFVFLLEQ